MARIFLCHASEDKAQVREVYRRLAAIQGFEPWLDEENLLPGQIWENEIPGRSAPLHVHYRMNTAYLLPNHWAHGFEGGGRIIGEACHILDMFRFLVGAPTIDVQAMGVHASGKRVILTDNFTATIRYADGSVCTLLYTAQGSQELPKEVMEIHVGGCSLSLDDFHKLRGFGVKADLYTKRQQKGHVEELVAFYQAISGALDRRILWQEAVEVTRTSLEIHQQVQDWNNKVADFSVLLSRPGFIRLSPRYSMKAHTYRRVRKPSYTLKVPCTVL